MDELIALAPQDVTSETRLGPQMMEMIYGITTQIRRERTAGAVDAWETEIVKKINSANLPSERLRALTYCVMYTVAEKDFPDPLMRSTNSTFANILFRECAKDVVNASELKNLIQLVYANQDAIKTPNPTEAVANLVNFTVRDKSAAVKDDKKFITGEQVQNLGLRRSDMNVPLSVDEMKIEPIEPANEQIEKHKLTKSFYQLQQELINQIETAAKSKDLTGLFKNKDKIAELDGMKSELQIVTAGLTYLKSNNAEDKTAFMKLYTAGILSEGFRSKMDAFFVREGKVNKVAAPPAQKSMSK
jgi:hypothetical protein